MKNDKIKYECEFGCSSPVNFLTQGSISFLDENGNEIFCECGQPVAMILGGNEGFLALCNECLGKKESQ